MPQKAFASGAVPWRLALSPGSAPMFSAFYLNFWPLGASSPLVTPVSGYAYVRVNNSKQ